MVPGSAGVTDCTGTFLFFETDTITYGKNTETDTRDIDDDGDGTFDRHIVELRPLVSY